MQFDINMQLVYLICRLDPYQVLPLWTRVNMGAMAMKNYSAFLKTPALLEPHHQIV